MREAYTRCQSLAGIYGDVVDYWEIDNEPDISFVPENPESLAAYLKACYLGIRAGAEAVRGRQPKKSPVPAAESRVLMGPLALPPGPYFDAFVRNDGLRYTDGFNYHYYGFAEDFTGVYRQFEYAVAEIMKDERGPVREAVLRTQFIPDAQGWQSSVTATFNYTEEASKSAVNAQLTRPLAMEEPAMKRSVRWLTSGGVAIEESGDGWRFRVEGWPEGPLRAPMVELPLPSWWGIEGESLLTFEYRRRRCWTALSIRDRGWRITIDCQLPPSMLCGLRRQVRALLHRRTRSRGSCPCF